MKVVLFNSRNKDNKNVVDFKQRSKVFVSDRSSQELQSAFYEFVEKGKVGEVSRFYHSVNTRDNDLVRKALMHYLLDHEDFDMTQISAKVASIAAKKENRKENKWLFDYDGPISYIGDFLEDVRDHSEAKLIIRSHKTPNGYAVVVNQGFDTRELLKKWTNVDLKRDDLLLVNWRTKNGEVS